MLYEITVIDTDEHEPTGFSRSAKFDTAHHFATFIVEAPAYRNYRHGRDEDGYERREYRIPDAVIAQADVLAQQYLPDATYNRTVLVQIAVLWPIRTGYRKGNGGAQTMRATEYLLNSQQLQKDERRHRVLARMG